MSINVNKFQQLREQVAKHGLSTICTYLEDGDSFGMCIIGRMVFMTSHELFGQLLVIGNGTIERDKYEDIRKRLNFDWGTTDELLQTLQELHDGILARECVKTDDGSLVQGVEAMLQIIDRVIAGITDKQELRFGKKQEEDPVISDEVEPLIVTGSDIDDGEEAVDDPMQVDPNDDGPEEVGEEGWKTRDIIFEFEVDEMTRELLLDAAEKVEAQGEDYNGHAWFRRIYGDNGSIISKCGCAMGEMVAKLTGKYEVPSGLDGMEGFLAQHTSIKDAEIWDKLRAWTCQDKDAQETAAKVREMATGKVTLIEEYYGK